MFGRNVFIILAAVVAVVAAVTFGADPEKAQRYVEMRREVGFSPSAQEGILFVVALAIGGYLAWHYFKRD